MISRIQLFLRAINRRVPNSPGKAKVFRSYLALLGIITLLAFLGMVWWFGSWPTAAIAHLILAVGVFPLILGAMIYFTPVLTRSGPAPWHIIRLPFLAMLAGGAGWLAVFHSLSLIVLAAPLGFVTSAVLVIWMGVRASRALGSPHPGFYWYQAALFCLMLGLLAIFASRWFPEHWLVLRNFHRCLNLLGFVAITAVGTLQVLLPTVGSYADPQASQRLHFDLKYAVAGSLLMAMGAAYQLWLYGLGLVFWGWVLGRLIFSLRGHLRQIWRASAAAISLTGAIFGLSLVLIHSLLENGVIALPLFFTVFLFPLVIGALGHLLPLWWWPGAQTSQRNRAQYYLGKGALFRIGTFWLGGGLLLAENTWGVYPITVALLLFLGQVVWARWSTELS